MDAMTLPVRPDDILDLAVQFRRRWSVKNLARVGLHQHVREILWGLLDNGEMLVPTTKELGALCDFLTESGAMDRAFDYDGTGPMKPELASFIRKVFFAHGRCYGLTNADMGVMEV